MIRKCVVAGCKSLATWAVHWAAGSIGDHYFCDKHLKDSGADTAAHYCRYIGMLR